MPINLPNLVTWLRILMIPMLVAVYYLPHDWIADHNKNLAATAIFSFAAITDWLDGYLARTLNQMSPFGAFLDPVADKLMVATALIMLVWIGRLEGFIAVIIIGREILIIGLKGAVASTGDLVQPSVWGKAKANVQFLAIFLAILRPGEPIGPLYLDQWAMIAAAVITVLSGLEYVLRFRGAITTGPRDPA